MKKLFLLVAVVAMVLPGCKKIEESIDATNARIDKLEQETIPTIDEQITAIQTSIEALEEIDKSLDESIKALEESDKATAEEITALKEADKAIETKIEDLKKYIDDVLKSTKDWVNATFATLEQLYALSSEVEALKSLVDANKTEAAANLATAISNLDASLKAWVGEQLSNYYTIAQIDAEIAALQGAITEGDAALQGELNKLKEQLETTKSEVTEAYKKAIKEAIETNNGVINAKIAEEIGKVNGLIEELNSKLAKLQIQVDKNTEDIAKLLARIQSVSYIPEYADGKVVITRMGSTSSGELSFRISPKDAIVELEKVWSEALSCEAYYPKTRAVSLVKLSVTEYVADAESGVISVKISGEGLSEEFFAGTQEAKVSLVISDGNNQVVSDYADAVGKEIIEEKPANNEIWYTSTDGDIVTPYATDAFGANIVSNTYENGKGVITFDGDVTLIGDGAFTECTSLTSLTMSDSISNIGELAFLGCCSLTNITIPNSVSSIGECAFYACTSLTSVSIPNSVISFGHSIFAACESLEAISGQFVSKDSRCLIINGELNSFAPSGLTTYAVPYSVTSIGYYAFCGCSSLTSITIPDSVTSLENRSFWFCTSLASITIPNGVTKIGENAFYNCSSLASITIPDSVTSIGENAFNRCTSLTSITIPNSVTSIGSLAFYECLFEGEDFINNSSLDAVANNYWGAKIYDVVQTDGLCINGTIAVYCRRTATSVTIPDSVTSIGGEAFSDCDSLTSVTIPDGVTSIGVAAFTSCDSLTSVTIPDSVTSIGDGAFQYCTSLTSATIGNNVTTIGRGAFSVCTSLTSVTIGNSVTSIGYQSFCNCTSLTSVTIPDSVTSIGYFAFSGCTSLTSVYCKPTTPPSLGNSVLPTNNASLTIYVPTDSVDAYKTASGWKDYAFFITEYVF